MTERKGRASDRLTTRERSARTEVAAVFIGVAVLSLLLVGVYNYASGRQLLDDAVQTSLSNIAESRASRIDSGLVGLSRAATVLAREEGVRAALDEFAGGFGDLDVALTVEEDRQLLDFYRAGVADLAPLGVDMPAAEELVPTSEPGRYLQYHYIVANPHPFGDREELTAVRDGTVYARAHAAHHPRLRALAANYGFGDLILIDATGSVVYSVEKRIDLGSDLLAGPYSDTSLGHVVADELGLAAAEEAHFADFEFYIPSRGAPTIFVVVPVRDGGQISGAVAAEVDVTALDEITTAGEDWAAIGLGDTGEVYVVGPDLLMRSDSRRWLEDQDGYLDAVESAGYPPEIATGLQAWGTTALVQTVDTEPAATASAGGRFVGPSTNYLGIESLSVAFPLAGHDLDWVVVAEMAAAEAGAPASGYTLRALLLTAVLLPLVAAAGFVLTRRLIRPVDTVATAAAAVGGGDLTTRLPADGRDEFSELGSRFNTMVAALRHQEEQLAQADADATELLASILPPHVIEQVKRGETNIAEAVHNATLIAFRLEVAGVDTSPEPESLQDARVEASAAISELADRHGAQHIHTSAGQILFATGLRTPTAETSRAARFALDAHEAVATAAERHSVTFEMRTGMAAGDVMTGVVGSERLAFDVWGEPVRVAIALAGHAAPGRVLADASVASEATEWTFRRAPGSTDVDGTPIDAWHIEPT